MHHGSISLQRVVAVVCWKGKWWAKWAGTIGEDRQPGEEPILHEKKQIHVM
jgi:hypothetical protein